MPRTIKRRSQKAGLPPGALVHIGERKAERTRITLLEYDAKRCEERTIASAAECPVLPPAPTITWLNVDGVHEVEALQHIGECFRLHPLVLEDILNTDQRPKLEDASDYLYIVLHALQYDDKTDEIGSEQVSLVLGPNFVVSFQERETDLLDRVKARLRDGRSRLRTLGADYLAYTLLDVIVDHYFAVLEKLGERVEALEERLVAAPSPRTLRGIHQLKREMIFLRRSIWPLREVIGALERGESPLVQSATRIYLRDVYDHIVQIIDNTETLRDMLSEMTDIYLSSVSNRLNEVMKVLTVIATVFMPLTFLAGVYGMNFRYMPELEWEWGYPAVWAVMIAIGVAMVAYFRRRKWF